MLSAPWPVAAITAIAAIVVAVVALLQWRIAQQKAAFELLDKRRAIYEVVRKAVGTIVSSSTTFDQRREIEYMQAMEDARFAFGDDVENYIKRLWIDITAVCTADEELRGIQDNEARREILKKRRAAMTRIAQFHDDGMPLFEKYMRFSQTVPMSLRQLLGRLWTR